MSADDEKPLLWDHKYLGPFVRFGYTAVDGPITWIRKNVVEANRGESYPFYHRQFRRVPTIDECYVDDAVCSEEANEQFQRDWKVESEILNILRLRMEECVFYEKGTGLRPLGFDDSKAVPVISVREGDHMCKRLYETYMKASENYFIKYGEMGYRARVEQAFMKQKHRLMWERRHGPIGTGMKPEEEDS